MRSVDVSIVTRNIKEMCIQANHFLSEDMDIAMKNAYTLKVEVLRMPSMRVCARDMWKDILESLL